MASGKLASIDITSASTDTQLYVVPSSMTSSFSICMVNRNPSTSALIRIALTTSSSITNDQYLCYDLTLYPNEVYERSGLVLAQGQFVYVRSSVTGVNAVMYGYEES